MSASAANAVYSTPGDSSVITFEKLSAIEGSGVTKTADKTYTLVNDIEVKAPDMFVLENGTKVSFGPDVLLRLYGGNHNFAPADTATFDITAEGVKPIGLHFLDMTTRVTLKHLRLDGLGVRFGGPYGCLVDSCSFLNHQGNKVKTTINFVGHGVGNEVRNCYFYRTAYSAVGTGSNVAAGVVYENNLFEDCSTANGNYPVINEIPGGNNGKLVIRNCKVYGGKRLKPGALSVSNMLSIVGENEIIIENNYLDNSRYGMNILGNGMSARIVGNTVKDCHYETVVNNGGSGITCYSTSATKPLDVYIQDNNISGCIWGITVVGATKANLGNLDKTSADYNPGGNVLRNNGNNGDATGDAETAFDPSNPIDLYNNTANTVYAQGNTWGDDEQTQENIEKRIVHKNDIATLGEVIFMSGTNGVDEVADASFGVRALGGGAIAVEGVAEGEIVNVYDAMGRQLYCGSAADAINLTPGQVVIVVAYGSAVRTLVK